MKKPFILGIAGGSGSGKSTLAVSLCKKNLAHSAVLHLDDYFKKEEEVPKVEGFTNWEDPEALRFDDIYKDLQSLMNGEPITIRTKSELYNPDYQLNKDTKIQQLITPKELLIVEGYLLFYDPRIRDLFDVKIFLDIDILESSKRRSSNKSPIDAEYLKNFSLPITSSWSNLQKSMRISL